MSKVDKLYTLLATGKNVSVAQIQRRTGLASVSAAIRDLRNEGYTIYLNQKGSNGNKQTFYRMAS